MHDLRHTHATLLLKVGVLVKVVSERRGHSTPAFTTDLWSAEPLPGPDSSHPSAPTSELSRARAIRS